MTDNLFLSTTVIVLVGGLILLSAILWAIPVRLWVEAISAGARVGIGYLVGMRLRKVVPPAVVRPLIWATKAGIILDVGDLEARRYLIRARDRRTFTEPRHLPFYDVQTFVKAKLGAFCHEQLKSKTYADQRFSRHGHVS